MWAHPLQSCMVQEFSFCVLFGCVSLFVPSATEESFFEHQGRRHPSMNQVVYIQKSFLLLCFKLRFGFILALFICSLLVYHLSIVRYGFQLSAWAFQIRYWLVSCTSFVPPLSQHLLQTGQIIDKRDLWLSWCLYFLLVALEYLPMPKGSNSNTPFSVSWICVLQRYTLHLQRVNYYLGNCLHCLEIAQIITHRYQLENE